MATLSDLSSKAMDAASNTNVAPHIDVWVRWVIDDVWNARLWPFRRRPMAAVDTVLNETSIQLPSNFAHPDNFRILTPQTEAGRLPDVDDNDLKILVPDPTDTTNASKPKVWRRPIRSDGTNKFMDFWPPADGIYGIGGDYFIKNPAIDGADTVLIPDEWHHVVTIGAQIYIKSHEEEVNLRPWQDDFNRALGRMMNDVMKNQGSLKGWKSERYLRNLRGALSGIANDLDIRR